MTDLEIRRIPFVFDETVPFQWNPTNPEFGITMNTVSIIAIAFEKYIVAATRQALPLLEDNPEVAAEADAFLRQEAQHARAHRLHMRALIAQYPGLQQTLDEAVASYDRLLEKKPLKFHLAYIAALEASFTPNFKMMLDNRDVLFAPGDTRVASLFEWHFVEEVEHRSSALVVYEALVPNKWYRLQVAPYAFAHVFGLAGQIARGFADHVPIEDTLVDPRRLDVVNQARHQLRRRLRKLGRRRQSARPPSTTPCGCRRSRTRVRTTTCPRANAGRRSSASCARSSRTTIPSTSPCPRSPTCGSTRIAAGST